MEDPSNTVAEVAAALLESAKSVVTTKPTVSSSPDMKPTEQMTDPKEMEEEEEHQTNNSSVDGTVEDGDDDVDEGLEDHPMNGDGDDHGGKAETSPSDTKNKVTVHKVKKTTAKPVRKKRKQKPKDYPKRPLSAYNIFFKETREKIIAEDASTGFQEMVRKIACHWKDITPEEKKKYEDRASKDKTRYKDQVGVYEKELADKNRKEREEAALMKKKAREAEKKRLAEEKMKNAKAASLSSGVASVGRLAGYAEADDRMRFASTLPHGVQFPYGMGIEEAIKASSMGVNSESSRDLEMARLRLEADLRGIEEARAYRLRQLELACMQGAGGLPSNDHLRSLGMFGGTGLGEHSELGLQRRFLSGAASGLGRDPLVLANEADLRKRLSMLRKPIEHSGEEQDQRFEEGDFGSLGGGLSQYSSALGMGIQGMGMSNPNSYEEILLREQMLRREREVLLGGSGAASLYCGGLGFGGGLSSFGFGAATEFGGMNGGSAAAAAADLHTSAAAAGLASLREQYLSDSRLAGLTEDDLRSLSAGRGLDALSKSVSAFKRVPGE